MNERPAALRSCGLIVLTAAALAMPAAAKEPPPKKHRAASDGKVTICHRTEGKNGTHLVTIRVSKRAVPAHVRNHNDVLGPCPTDGDGAAANSGVSEKGKAKPEARPSGHWADTQKGKSKVKGEPNPGDQSPGVDQKPPKDNGAGSADSASRGDADKQTDPGPQHEPGQGASGDPHGNSDDQPGNGGQSGNGGKK